VAIVSANKLLMKVNKAEMAEMVDKHGDALVELPGEFLF
jgi:hypothetical protein